MARKYVRDKNGRFASTGGGGKSARKSAPGLSRARPGQEGRALRRASANMKRSEQAAMRGNSKAGVSFAVSRGAQDYYTGKMKRTGKATFKPLTSSRNKKRR